MQFVNSRLLFILVAMFSCVNVYANNNSPFKLAIPSFPPFYFEPGQDNSIVNHKKGSVVLYVELLEQHVDYPIEIVNIPFARIPSSLLNGEIDGAITFKNNSLSRITDYFGPVSKSHILLIPEKNRTIEYYDDLYLLETIAVVRGASFDNKFDGDLKLSKYFVKDYNQGLNMLARGRAQAVIGGVEALDYYLKIEGRTMNDFGTPIYINDKEIGLHIGKKSPYLKESTGLKNIIDSLYEPYLFQTLYLSELPSKDHALLGNYDYLQLK